MSRRPKFPKEEIRSVSDDAVVLADLRAAFKRMDISACVQAEVEVSGAPVSKESAEKRLRVAVDPIATRKAWAALWHKQNPLIGHLTTDLLKGDPQRVHPSEWVIAVRAYFDLARKSGIRPRDMPNFVPSGHALNEACNRLNPVIWSSNRRKAQIILQEGLFHVGLPPVPVFLSLLTQYTNRRSGTMTRNALGLLSTGVSVGLAAIGNIDPAKGFTSAAIGTSEADSEEPYGISDDKGIPPPQSVMHDKEVNIVPCLLYTSDAADE